MSLHILKNKILQLCEPADKDMDFLGWHDPYAVINGLSKIKPESWNHFITFNELTISQEEEWSVQGQWWVETYLQFFQFVGSQQIYFWYLMCPSSCTWGMLYEEIQFNKHVLDLALYLCLPYPNEPAAKWRM